MRRAVLVALALACLAGGPAQAQVRQHGRMPRKLLMAGIGALAGGLVSLLYGTTSPGFDGPCSSNGCVTSVSLAVGLGAGYLIGREFDQLYNLRYRHAPPLALRGQSLPLSVLANDIAAGGGALAAAGEEGVEIVLTGPRLERGDVRARGLRGVISALPSPEANRLLVATATGLYGFALTGERVAGNLLAGGEVNAMAVRGDLAVLVTEGAVRSARLAGDSLVGLTPPRPFESRATDLAWDPERPVVWVLTETALIALAASDSGVSDSIGALPLQGLGRRLALRGARAAVAEGDGGVMTGDIGDPRAPRALAQWVGARFAYDVALSAGGVFVAAGPEGLYVLSLSADGTLEPLGLARGLGFVAALDSDADNVFLLDRTGGLLRRIPVR